MSSKDIQRSQGNFSASDYQRIQSDMSAAEFQKKNIVRHRIPKKIKHIKRRIAKKRPENYKLIKDIASNRISMKKRLDVSRRIRMKK